MQTAPVKRQHMEEVTALTRAHGAVVARIRTRAASAERARIAGIRSLGRVGQESVLQGCIDDASCTVERAALTLLQHEQGKRAAHGHGTVPDHFGGLGMQSLSR